MSNGNTCIKDEQIFEMSNLERMATKGQKREYMYIPDSLRRIIIITSLVENLEVPRLNYVLFSSQIDMHINVQK